MAVLAQETVNKLLDFNERLDIGLLDDVVGTLYSGQGEQHKMAQEALTTLKEHPDAWTKVSLVPIQLFRSNSLRNLAAFLTTNGRTPRIDQRKFPLEYYSFLRYTITPLRNGFS